MHHLNVRVPWHDNRWNGCVCKDPAANSFCVDLPRIRKEKNEIEESKPDVANRHFADLDPNILPPCKSESGAFMSSRDWWRIVHHPYQDIAKTQETHGHLLPTRINVPAFSTFAVPFWWMLKMNQKDIDNTLPKPLSPDEPAPFRTAWVFARKRQEELSSLFFGRLNENKSLVFFYTKSGHPLEESYSRLVVGVGHIDKIHKMKYYDCTGGSSYPMWDRLIEHSIRPEGTEGMLFPYHDYLESTGDPDEDSRRRQLLNEIAVVPEKSQSMAFSYVGELSTTDVALSTLIRCTEVIRKIREHGISSGPWERRQEWLNKQIAETWKDRGAFPGTGSALEALGMRLGTTMVLELTSNGTIGRMEDPWPILDAIFRGRTGPPQKSYGPDIEAVAATWMALSDERRALLKLLSRFNLSPSQASRWFDQSKRGEAARSALDDSEILANPYCIVENDLGDENDHPVHLGVLDRGLLPDASITAAHPVPAPSAVASPLDVRRVRAAFVTVLRNASSEGDSLLTEEETFEKANELDLAHPCNVSSDWVNGNINNLSCEIDLLELPVDSKDKKLVRCLQLSDIGKREKKLASILKKRSDVAIPSTNEIWKDLITKTLREKGIAFDKGNQRHMDALNEQSIALEKITTRKLSVLVGRAGTGKTTVLGALVKSDKLHNEGILFLAPTGKARVKLGHKTNAMTVAQFLYRQNRYDILRQLPLFDGDQLYMKEKNVVIDECSMLTMDDLFAVLCALDLGHVQRIILVGDPNQLPPIGIGRPFADLVAFMDSSAESNEGENDALSRLTVELRTQAGSPSDTLRLASWFTREPQPVDADRVFSDLELGANFNDLRICYWQTPNDLHKRFEELFIQHLGHTNIHDVEGFNISLGLTPEGWIPFDDHDGAENFQILSPVRREFYGICDINRWVQGKYRASQLRQARQRWGLSLGDEEIVWGDKVILLRNGTREGWDGKRRKKDEQYLANGEVGMAASAFGDAKGKLLNVAFVGRPDTRFGFMERSFSEEDVPLELAYALTVHKAQGSEFKVVFVIIPKRTRLLTKELLYTALTRSKDQLVLLIEGADATVLYNLINRSETARRNTNLFEPGIRSVSVLDSSLVSGKAFYAAHLVHRTSEGYLVRSKSELAIAEHLYGINMKPQYERPLDGEVEPRRLRPDFSFVDDAGNVIIWEHLGMLNRADYRRGWEWKRDWYEKNGYIEGKNLFTTSEEDGLDMIKVDKVAERIRAILSE